MALENNIQSLNWTAECVGTASLVINNNTETVYFVVVNSPALFELRKKINEAFIRNGGDKKAFDPNKYEPHVTLGYTKRDLFMEDGVSKNKISCWKSL